MRHVIGLSGGIDSQAAALWVLNRFAKDDVTILNSPAGGNEHPLTTEHVKWFSDNIHPVIVVPAIIADMWVPGSQRTAECGYPPDQELTFDLMAKIKGRFPSRVVQFCTEKLKLIPMRRWSLANLTPGSFERYSGVRRSESPARERTVYRCYDDFFDCQTNHPVFDWTKQMCFDYVQSHGQEINPLYKLGFSRVGCAPCVNSSKADILAWAERFPEMIDKVRDWERSTGTTFFAPIVPGKTDGSYNFIDEVVLWAKTSRGGRQFPMFVEERPACESAYGLCE